MLSFGGFAALTLSGERWAASFDEEWREGALSLFG